MVEMNNTMKYSMIFLAGTILIVSILLPYASNHPDGLEKVAETFGFSDVSEEIYTGSPIQNYDLTGEGTYFGVFMAEIIGILATLALGFGVGFIMKKNASRIH